MINLADRRLSNEKEDKILHFLVKYDEKLEITNITVSDTVKPVFSIKNTTNYNLIASQWYFLPFS